MRLSTLLLPITALAPLVSSQAAGGGGVAAAPTIVATQDATVKTMPSIFTVNGVTSVTYKPFTQTFAATALGSWDFDATPRSGVIGLGDIQGEVGKVRKQGEKKKKRSFGVVERVLQTRWAWRD